MLHYDTTLLSGHEIAVRPLDRGDETTVQDIFDSMSPEARYHRFLQATPRLTSSMRRLLADVDGERHKAAVAWHAGRPVGIVRLVSDRHGDVELAVSVVDAFHGRRLGPLLVSTALGEFAQDQDKVMIVVHPQNSRAVRLFRRLGFVFGFEEGILVGRRIDSDVAVAA